MPAPSPFGVVDWIVLAAYLATVLAIGLAVSRRRPRGDELLLASRRMPLLAVSASVLATSLSAATFIGGPEQSFRGDLTYLSANLGALLAVIVVATVFLPAFYRHGVTSIYELLGHEFGGSSRRAASLVFMIGRVMASGARLFIVALPFSLIAWGTTDPSAMLASIAIIASAAMLYTVAGGIRAVIWTDVLQLVVVTVTVVAAFLILLDRIPLSPLEIVDALRTAPGGDKLRVIDVGLDPARPYTLWTAIIGFTLFNIAAYGTDQDLTQRMLTCRSARAGAWSVILSNVMSWPLVAVFLGIGVLLSIFYTRPELMGAVAPETVIDDTRAVFLRFILEEMPSGLRGLMTAGLFAAAMSSTDSALNALASTVVADFDRPRRRERGLPVGDSRETRLTRGLIVGWAILLAAFAAGCVFWQQRSGQTLIDFALGVMVYAYAGLLGVFLCAIATNRGNAVSAIAALVVGGATVLLLGLDVTASWMGTPIAFPWVMTVASTASFLTCAVGRRQRASRPSRPSAA